MRFVRLVYEWLFQRLPLRFSIPLLVIATLYFTVAFPWLVYQGTRRFIASAAAYLRIPAFTWEWLNGGDIVAASVVTVLVVVGVVLSYGLAGAFYRLWRPRPMRHLRVHAPVSPTAAPVAGPQVNPLAHYQRIGVILAGGGAKGAYQAGALTAIHEFLARHGAHRKVRMIAGTSIGSWNALFWLADLVKGPDGTRGLLEEWWHAVDVQSILRPAFYVPLRQNYFLSSEPWRESFDRFFLRNRDVRERLRHHLEHPDATDAVHFYFTRSNVARAQLEFTTNRRDLSDVVPNLTSERRPRPPVPRDIWLGASSVEDIRSAVFASMDLPPLFEYARIGDEIFEDGGVVDNLPIRFGTEIEKCDLLFVLPLNASFEETPNLHSIVKRLMRVTNVRQGVLERNAFKMVYLYNELAALRRRTHGLQEALARVQGELRNLGVERRDALASTLDRRDRVVPDGGVAPSIGPGSAADDSGERASRRTHQAVQVFAITPAPPLAIDTVEFWKTGDAGKAFRLMHEYTAYELQKFDFQAAPDWIRMALVSPHGQVTYLEDF